MDGDHLSRFLAVVKNWGRANDAAAVSFIAYRDDVSWRLSYAVVVLSPIDKFSSESINVSTELLKAGRFRVSNLDQEKLTQLFNGELVTPSGTFSINSKDQASNIQYLADGFRPTGTTTVRSPILLVNNISSESMRSKIDFQEVEYQLRSHTIPYESMDDLLSAIGLQRDIPFSDSRRIEILMGIPADIILARSKIDNGQAVITVAGNPKLARERVRLGVRVPKDGGFSRSSIAGAEMEWESDGEAVYGKAKIAVGAAKYLQAFLSVNGEAISKWWIVDQQRQLNARTVIHRLFDRDDKKLKRLLFPSRTESRDLERGAALLLGLCGFSVLHYGEKETVQEGPDLIAETTGGRRLIVECTTEMADTNTKSIKLLQRKNRIVQELTSNEFDSKGTLPVLITTMTRAELTDQFEAFREKGIVLVTRDDLENLVERVVLPPNSDLMWDELSRSIQPATPDFFKN